MITEEGKIKLIDYGLMENINSSYLAGTDDFSHPLKVNAFHIGDYDEFYNKTEKGLIEEFTKLMPFYFLTFKLAKKFYDIYQVTLLILFLEYKLFEEWKKIKSCFKYANLDLYCFDLTLELIRYKS